MDNNNVVVDLGDRSYTIAIQSGLFSDLSGTLTRILRTHQGASHPQLPKSVFLVTDSNVGPLYVSAVVEELSKLGLVQEPVIIEVPAGEASKSVAEISRIWNRLIDAGADRSSHVVALGGGVVGDLAGFAAASYARGIRMVQIPTSLLSQVDSSVGGKVGINLDAGKNMVGAFWQPVAVLIDPRTLDTLEPREFRSGLAEVVKYGVIMDEPFFQYLEQNVGQILDLEPKTLTEVIRRCCELKAEVVRADETEQSGRRAILNYGHTFGHAIEKVYGYGHYTHGEAISIGMHSAAKLSCQLGLVDQAMVDRQASLLRQFELPLQLESLSEERIADLLRAMQSDKKVAAGKLNMILAKRLGEVAVYPAPDSQLIAASFR